MSNEIALVISSLGVGGLLGVFAKSFLDRRQLKFSKLFEYKEERYRAMANLMLSAVNPTQRDMEQLEITRPGVHSVADIHEELEAEYYYSMLFASDDVLGSFAEFLKDKSTANYQAVVQAMRKDLYL
jgi:hypothetical protein